MEGIGELGQEDSQFACGQHRLQALSKLGQFGLRQPPFVGEDLPRLGGEAEIRGRRHRGQPAPGVIGIDGPVKGDVHFHRIKQGGQEGEAVRAFEAPGIDHPLPVGIIPNPRGRYKVLAFRVSVGWWRAWFTANRSAVFWREAPVCPPRGRIRTYVPTIKGPQRRTLLTNHF